MAFHQFSEYQYVRTMDTSEIIKLGGFKTQNNIELYAIRVLVYINGTLNGQEKLRLNAYADSAQSKKIFHSEWTELNNTIENQNGETITGNWLGMLRFLFSRQQINKNTYYYLGLEPIDYTRNADTFYIGASHDYPFPRYSNNATAAYETNIAFEIYGYE